MILEFSLSLSLSVEYQSKLYTQVTYIPSNNTIEKLLTYVQTRDGNGAGSRRVTPIPTLPHLFETILILVLFKKLNEAGRGRRV